MFWIERGQVESNHDREKECHFYKLHKALTYSSQTKQARCFPQSHAAFLKATPQDEGQGDKQAQSVVWKTIHLQSTVDAERWNDGKPTDFSSQDFPLNTQHAKKSFCHTMPDGGKKIMLNS